MTSLIDTQRATRAIAGLARPRTMYMRMATIPCCARCAVLAGKKGFWEKPFQRHPMCDCDQIPIPMDKDVEFTGPEFSAAEYFESLPEKEQDRIFTVAGAQAIREGADIAQVVNSRQGMTGATKGFTRVRSQWMRKESRRRMSIDAIMSVKDPVTRWEMLKEQGDIRPVSVGGSIELGRPPKRLLGVSRKRHKTGGKSPTEVNPTGDMKNCVRCVQARAMMEVGYSDIEAIAGEPRENARQSVATWTDDKGNHPVWHDSETNTHAMKFAEVRQHLNEMEVGAFGVLRYRGIVGYAHVVFWKKTLQGLVIEDPQNRHYDVEYELEVARPGSYGWASLLGFKPGERTVRIVKGAEHEQ
ncbi:hypothetical protein [Corynebacterium glucuronolyticum]|uniref:hypothetical protein n=1 Tax=Corynebacterium glucuronolyticum TaxID=39791 RepID=UPI00223A761D|nr:hypothetical protein [Corynebacterium glucuronolyticum]MCT1442639.1 hypothetical protein [Corynebacterium glucuronolyticum]MCT1563335.1 hypothetical protein [Corynebacterium glucuronolyticum]